MSPTSSTGRNSTACPEAACLPAIIRRSSLATDPPRVIRADKFRSVEAAQASTPSDCRMSQFSRVPCSDGPRREFKITWGLRAGYQPTGRIHDLEEAIRAAHRWMRQRDQRGAPFLSGMFTRGEVVYASAGNSSQDREPVAIFTGEVLPLYAGDLDDDVVRDLLNELAGEIGTVLEQEDVHIAYRDRTWTLKRTG
jgi:hypothetical protein